MGTDAIVAGRLQKMPELHQFASESHDSGLAGEATLYVRNPGLRFGKPSMQRALIFDMDGTMFDNMAYHRAAMVEYFRRLGRHISEEEAFRATGRRDCEVLREYFGELSDAQCARMEAEWVEVYRALYAPHRRLLDGLDELVGFAVKAGIASAVATSASAESMRLTLEGFEVCRHFSAFVSAEDVRLGKPAPDIFLMAATLCHAAPANCIVFEDSPAGMQAAQRAGMRAVALATTFPPEAFIDFDNVIAVVRDFQGLDVEPLFSTQLGLHSGAAWPKS